MFLTIQLPTPVANALPLPRICIGMISDMYTLILVSYLRASYSRAKTHHEIGPKESENRMDTQKTKNTPPIDMPCLLPVGLLAYNAASHASTIEIEIAPKIRGFLRPTRSIRNVMKKRLVIGPTQL